MATGNRTVLTCVIALGNVCTIGLAMALAAILSRTLDKQAYGTFRQILYVYTTIAVVFEAGLPKAASYFLPKVPLEEGKDLLVRILAFLAISGLVFSCLLYLGADIIGTLLRNDELPQLLRAYSMMPLILLPTTILAGVCMTHGRATSVAVFQVVTKLATLATVSSLVLLGYPLIVVIRAWVLVSVCTLVLAIHFMFAPYRGTRMQRGPYGTMDVLRFGLPLVCASIVGTLLTGADRFIVSRIFGAEVFATYVNGAMELPFSLLITSSIGTVLLPDFSRIASTPGGATEICDIWKRTVAKSAAVLYPCTVFALFFAEDIMTLLYSPQYVMSSPFFRVYLGLGFLRVFPYLPLMLGIGAVGSYVLGHMLACMTAWLGGFVLCMWLDDPIWAAVSYVLSAGMMLCWFLYVLSKRVKLPVRSLLPWRNVMAYLAISLGAGAFAWLAMHFLVAQSPAGTIGRIIGGLVIFGGGYILGASALGYDVLSIVAPIVRRRFSRPVKA